MPHFYRYFFQRSILTMVSILIFTTLFLTCTGKNEQKSAEKVKDDLVLRENFKSLFNGENWNGWYLKLRNGDSLMAQKVFSIENGMVHVFKDMPDSLDLNNGEYNTHGMLYREETFDRFIIRFEYKWGNKIANNFDQFQYDAGLYYHVYDDAIWPKGLEYQIRYDHIQDINHTGDFWAKHVHMKWHADEKGSYLSPSDGGILQDTKKNELRAKSDAKFNGLNKEWNYCEAIVMGDKYSIHKLNGEVVNVGTDLTRGKGILGFQSETAEIYYRNIEIMELDEFIPINYFLKK